MSDKIIVEIDEFLQEIIPGFLENRVKEQEDLKSAISEGNFAEIQVIGHKLSGNGGSYGFDQLSELGGKLEESAKNENIEDVKVIVDEIHNYVTNVEVKYV